MADAERAQIAAVCDDSDALEELLAHERYSVRDKARIAEIIARYSPGWQAGGVGLLTVRQILGQLYRHDKVTGEIEITAGGRGDWTGWVQIAGADADWRAVRNAARVVHVVNPDVLLLFNVRDDAELRRFNEHVLASEVAMGRKMFPFQAFAPGCNASGAGIGCLLRLPLQSSRRLVVAANRTGESVFWYVSPEYEIALPNGKSFRIFAYLFNRGRAASGPTVTRRHEAALSIVAMCQEAVRATDNVIVVGGGDDVAASPVARELETNVGFREVRRHPACASADRDDGTVMLLSPGAWSACAVGGIEGGPVDVPRNDRASSVPGSETDRPSFSPVVWSDLSF